MIEEHILKHIHQVFDERVQYVCIAADKNPLTRSDLVYIHITLHKRTKRRTYFMKPIAG